MAFRVLSKGMNAFVNVLDEDRKDLCKLIVDKAEEQFIELIIIAAFMTKYIQYLSNICEVLDLTS